MTPAPVCEAVDVGAPLMALPGQCPMVAQPRPRFPALSSRLYGDHTVHPVLPTGTELNRHPGSWVGLGPGPCPSALPGRLSLAPCPLGVCCLAPTRA